MINVAPGGPSSIINEELTTEQRDVLIHRLGLDEPLPTRYARWLGQAIRGDLGLSLAGNVPVVQLIGERLPRTVELGALALIVATLVGVPLGVGAALLHKTLFEHVIATVTVLGIALPSFWFAILLILLFSVQWHLLPSSGAAAIDAASSLGDELAHVVMPTAVLVIGILPAVVQFTRASMLDVLREDYIRTATAKGLMHRQVVFVHALRNALTPVVSVIGTLIPNLVSGAVVTEVVFSWPGLGRLGFEAASHRDYPLVMGITVVVAAVVLLTSLVIDLSYAWLDPRIRIR